MKKKLLFFIIIISALIAPKIYPSQEPNTSESTTGISHAASSINGVIILIVRISDDSEREREHILDEIERITGRRSFIQDNITEQQKPLIEKLFLSMNHSPTAAMIHLLIFMNAHQTLKFLLRRLSQEECSNLLSCSIGRDVPYNWSGNRIHWTQVTALMYATTFVNYDVLKALLENYSHEEDIDNALHYLIYHWPAADHVVNQLRVVDLLISYAPNLLKQSKLHAYCSRLFNLDYDRAAFSWWRLVNARLNQIKANLPTILSHHAQNRAQEVSTTIGTSNNQAGLMPVLLEIVSRYDDNIPVRLPSYSDSEEVRQALHIATVGDEEPLRLELSQNLNTPINTHLTSRSSTIRNFLSAIRQFAQHIFRRTRQRGVPVILARTSSDIPVGSAATAH